MKTKIALALFTILPIITGIAETKACVGHFFKENWPPHAMFHMFMGLGGLLAAYGLILVLAWIPLRKGESWAWFAISFIVLMVHGGQLLSDFVTDGGLRNQESVVASGPVLLGIIATILLLYVFALALTWNTTEKA